MSDVRLCLLMREILRFKSIGYHHQHMSDVFTSFETQNEVIELIEVHLFYVSNLNPSSAPKVASFSQLKVA